MPLASSLCKLTKARAFALTVTGAKSFDSKINGSSISPSLTYLFVRREPYQLYRACWFACALLVIGHNKAQHFTLNNLLLK